MKKLIFYAVLILMFTIWGCSKSDSNNGNPVVPGGGNSPTLSIEIRSQQGQNGGTEFDGKPNLDITITEVNVDETTTGFNDVVQGDGTTVFKKDEWVLINEYTGVQTGMKFKFNFIGKTHQDGKDFNITSTYTVP